MTGKTLRAALKDVQKACDSGKDEKVLKAFGNLCVCLVERPVTEGVRGAQVADTDLDEVKATVEGFKEGSTEEGARKPVGAGGRWVILIPQILDMVLKIIEQLRQKEGQTDGDEEGGEEEAEEAEDEEK